MRSSLALFHALLANVQVASRCGVRFVASSRNHRSHLRGSVLRNPVTFITSPADVTIMQVLTSAGPRRRALKSSAPFFRLISGTKYGPFHSVNPVDDQQSFLAHCIEVAPNLGENCSEKPYFP